MRAVEIIRSQYGYIPSRHGTETLSKIDKKIATVGQCVHCSEII